MKEITADVKAVGVTMLSQGWSEKATEEVIHEIKPEDEKEPAMQSCGPRVSRPVMFQKNICGDRNALCLCCNVEHLK